MHAIGMLTLLAALGGDPAAPEALPAKATPARSVETIRADLDPSKPVETRVSALWEALNFAGPGGPLVNDVRRCTKATDPEVRAQAVTILGYAAYVAKSPIPTETLAALTDSAKVVRRGAMEGLSLFDRIPNSAAKTFIDFAADPDHSVRMDVMSVLGRIEKPTDAILRTLRKGTSDESPLVRGNAAIGLWRFDDERPVAIAVWLRAHADTPAVPEDREPTEVEEIGQIASITAAFVFKGKSEDEPVAFAKALAPHLNGPSPAFRRVAAQQVYAGCLGSQAMREASREAGLVPRLEKLLDDEDVRTRSWATQALELLSD